MKTKLTLDRPFRFYSVLGFCMYFAVLFAERLQSIIRTLSSGISFFRDPLSGYMYVLTVTALLSSLGLLIVLLSRRKEGNVPLFLSAASVALLFGGMVHTEFTVAPIQFVSYGGLILSMLFSVLSKKDEPLLKRLFAFFYVVAFSMAIPVVYMAVKMKNPTPYHIVESVTSFLLVLCFGRLLYLILTGGKLEKLLSPLPIALAFILDAVTLYMGRQEGLNMFVVVALGLATVLYIVAVILQYTVKQKEEIPAVNP